MSVTGNIKIDVREYMKRIGYSGDLSPNSQLLAKLQESHLLSVPFENFDIHYGTRIILDTGKFFDKIVRKHRGGFCYELNGLFYELLIALNFKAILISARAYNRNKGFGPEYDHLSIIVDLNGTKYLTDVGFGEFSLSPLKMELGIIQRDRTGMYKIDKYDEDYFRVSKLSENTWMPEFIFTGVEKELGDYSEMCLFHQTSPASHFTQKRLCSLATESGRMPITGNSLKIRNEKVVEEVPIPDEAEFYRILWEYFKITLG